jgi:hypothetical protein
MSDNLRVYRAIRDALHQLYPTPPKGDFARHLTTLAMLITGVVQSRKSQLPAIARKVPDGNRPPSRIKRLTRWLKNGRITVEAYYLPFARVLLSAMTGPLILVIDSSEAGDGCCTWMVSVIYRQRALPLVWTVANRPKGHASDEEHLRLLEAVKAILPDGRQVIFLGDGEFDGTPLQQAFSDWGWNYVLRTAKNRQIGEVVGEETDAEETLWFRFSHLAVAPGETAWVEDARFTKEAFGPVLVVATWPPHADDPIYLVSNLETAGEACHWYRKRFGIETFFSDQKSRGFHLHKSHLSDPKRLARLMIGTCLAYLWIVFLGVKARQDGWQAHLHRTSRCDWSLFQLGFALLDELLNQSLLIPVFLSPPSHPLKSVR